MDHEYTNSAGDHSCIRVGFVDGSLSATHPLPNGAKDARSCARRYEQRSDVPHHRRGHDSTQPAGPGYKEEVYERALAAELREREIPCETQYRVDVQYEGAIVAVFFLDLFVERTVVVEVKAFAHQLTDDERAQVINYLKATQAPIGLLLNFGRRKLEYRRIFPGSAGESGLPERLGRDNVKRGG
jgi:GxxExxY protein